MASVERGGSHARGPTLTGMLANLRTRDFASLLRVATLTVGAPASTLRFKLRAVDHGEYVYWVSARVDFQDAPPPPHGGPYTDLHVEAWWT